MIFSDGFRYFQLAVLKSILLLLIRSTSQGKTNYIFIHQSPCSYSSELSTKIFLVQRKIYIPVNIHIVRSNELTWIYLMEEITWIYLTEVDFLALELR
jgi:hypothetical protein